MDISKITDSKGKCQRCERTGHIAANCWANKTRAELAKKSQSNNESSQYKAGKKKGACNYCQIEGHFKNECQKFAHNKKITNVKPRTDRDKKPDGKRHGLKKVDEEEEKGDKEEIAEFEDGASLNQISERQ